MRTERHKELIRKFDDKSITDTELKELQEEQKQEIKSLGLFTAPIVQKTTLHFFSDAGHGWLKVPRKLLSENTLCKISGYSYQSKDYVYLEEDRDCQIAINQLGRDNIKIIDHYSNHSRIRNYDLFEHHGKEQVDICVHCGRDTGAGSGLWVDRIPVYDDYIVNKDCDRSFPNGNSICRECEDSYNRSVENG